jgi:phosphoglycerol transferase
VLLVGVWDQTSPRFAYDYDAFAASFRSDRSFAEQAERVLPEGAAVFQIPVVTYPEAKVGQQGFYDNFRPYVHSDDLSWSYGVVKGRHNDWQATLADKPREVIVAMVAAAGFEGLSLDRLGVGPDAPGWMSELRRLLGRPRAASPDGRYVLFDLRGYLARHPRLREPSAREAALRPIRFEPVSGLADAGREGGTQVYSAQGPAVFRVMNPSERPREVSLTVGVQVDRPAALAIRWPGGGVQQLRIRKPGRLLTRRVRLRPGRSALALAAGAPARVTAVAVDSVFLPGGE